MPDGPVRRRPAASVAPPVGCWYAAQAHRPAVGWCPPACSGRPTHSERAADGALRLYCDAHAYWRRTTIRLPRLRRIPPDTEPPRAPPGAGARRVHGADTVTERLLVSILADKVAHEDEIESGLSAY